MDTFSEPFCSFQSKHGSVFIYQPPGQNAAPFFYLILVSRKEMQASDLEQDSLPGADLAVALASIGRSKNVDHFAILVANDPLKCDVPAATAAPWIDLFFGDHRFPYLDKTGYLLWAMDPVPAQLDLKQMTYLSLRKDPGFPDWYLNPKDPGLFLPDPAGYVLRPHSQNAAQGVVAIDQTNWQLTIGTASKAPDLVCGGDRSPGVTGTNCAITVTFNATTDHQPGDISLAGSVGPSFLKLPLGFAYGLVPDPGLATASQLEPSALFYPLWDQNADFQSGYEKLDFDLVPLKRWGGLRHSAGVDPQPSALRTPLGETVLLQGPDPDSATNRIQYFIQNQPDGGYHFAPVLTDFTASVKGRTGPLRIACGLTAGETLLLPADNTLFFAIQPAAAQVSTSANGDGSLAYREIADTPWWTSLLQISVDSEYTIQSRTSPLFDLANASDASLVALGPGTIKITDADKLYVPLLPYAGLTAAHPNGTAVDLDQFVAFESNYLSPLRQRTIESRTESVQFGDFTTAMTPQGFQVDSNDSTLTLTIGGTPGVVLQVQKDSTWGTALFEGLYSNQPFFVISMQPDAKSLSINMNMDGWSFDPTLPDATPADFSGPILIVKACEGTLAQMVANPANWCSPGAFNNLATDRDCELLAAHIRASIDAARGLYANGQGVAAFGDFVELVDDPHWTGALALNVPVDTSAADPVIRTMLVGADLSGGPVTAHHLGLTPVRLGIQSTPACGAFGLVYYLRPGASPQDALSGNPGFVSSSNPYDFRLSYMYARFHNSVLIDFSSTALLIVGSLFDETVIPSSLDKANAPAGTNALFILGSAHRANDGGIEYAFAAPPNVTSVLYLNSAAVDQVAIDTVTTVASFPAPPADSRIEFFFAGRFRLRSSGTNSSAPVYDLLSYESLHYQNLSVVMTYDTASNPPTLNIGPGSPPLMLTPGEAQLSTQTDPHQQQLNLFRPGSLTDQMPLIATDLLRAAVGAPLPAARGYQPIKLAFSSMPELNSDSLWYGLLLHLDMGGGGNSSSQALLGADLLLAWQTGGTTDGRVAYQAYLAFVGPDGTPLDLEIENVIKLGIGSLRLSATQRAQSDPLTYVLELQGLGLHILSTTIPAGGGLTLYLAGYPTPDGNRQLAWFGGAGQYVEVPTK